jgi:hypothetical protein
MLEFKFITEDNTVLRGSETRRIGGSAADLAERQRDLTPVMARLGPMALFLAFQRRSTPAIAAHH